MQENITCIAKSRCTVIVFAIRLSVVIKARRGQAREFCILRGYSSCLSLGDLMTVSLISVCVSETKMISTITQDGKGAQEDVI